MKWAAFILLLAGCVSSRKTFTTINLDGSRSRILNGNGKGFFKTWQWRQIEGQSSPIDNAGVIVTQTKIGAGNYAWELTGIDNLNNIGKDTFYYPKK